MNNDTTERISSSINSKFSPSMIIPKREPIENDFSQNNKRRFGEHLSNDTDTIMSNKRQMATKKNQHIDQIQSKFINGNNDEQRQKQTESYLTSNSPKMNNQKTSSNGGVSDIPSSPSSTQAKPRFIDGNSDNTMVRPQVSSSPLGIPRPANPSRFTAPVHIDVGGTIFTSSLETLTCYPESRLSKLFNGTIPIVLDTLKQHYFIDRDGKLFRYILNFMRYGTLALPDYFSELPALLEEARYFELIPLINAIEERLNQNKLSKNIDSFTTKNNKQPILNNHDVFLLNISQDRVLISGNITLLHDLFPEIQEEQQQQQQQTTPIHAHVERNQFIRFTLNAFIHLTQLEIFQRLFDSQFIIVASTCGTSMDTMTQFSEYIFSRSKSNHVSSI
ncbi:unnamed protein product [Rotaria magnacalcarata]|uniref:BTB domain-containing protein n=8 Tax=Rotaria magnacalcarata TaxID=392030 RepID=A0A816YQF6_9BILA|nr:unnamed protein product [Rotaria magnacalcarata]CAF1382316.1 unnamed protein product [Rotaria magnacalcarata]CAF1944975.1 unnamed protein product [Rotaria magnacalcarata]CAF2164440.1 unnamed protein product [Rotaria magnacalcarata]CAF3742234.1 unnamed protein product [Rotaria magnacalcarata]